MKYLLPFYAALLLTACGGADSGNAQTPATGGDNAAAAPLSTAERGQRAFGECGICHSVRQGDPARVGPNLFGIYGSTAGAGDGFSYSRALRESGIIWDDETLDAFIANPQKMIRGNRMGYAGQSNTETRADMIAYLKTLQPNTD